MTNLAKDLVIMIMIKNQKRLWKKLKMKSLKRYLIMMKKQEKIMKQEKKAERVIIKMKPIYDNNEISAELAGVEKEIRKSLLKIYKEYAKIAGQENEIYLAMFINTTEEGLVISANNAYFDDESFDSETPLKLWEKYEK